jgi:hypothetical protein
VTQPVLSAAEGANQHPQIHSSEEPVESDWIDLDSPAPSGRPAPKAIVKDSGAEGASRRDAQRTPPIIEDSGATRVSRPGTQDTPDELPDDPSDLPELD